MDMAFHPHFSPVFYCGGASGHVCCVALPRASRQYMVTATIALMFTIAWIPVQPAAALDQPQEGIAEEAPLAAQEETPSSPLGSEPAEEANSGLDPQASHLKLPNSEKFRLGFRFMAGYGQDLSQATLGLERQGRIGYAIFEVNGKLSDQFSYRVEINPVNEVEPLPACGEADFFFPNMPQAFGPNVSCHNDGRLRVDDYRFIALDLLRQQGPIRQAYLLFESGLVSVKAGRFILPIGFYWEDAGSFCSKDATHIQRINAETNFGGMFSLTRRAGGRRIFEISAAAFLGDGNRFHDYDYFYGMNGSLDTNSGITLMLSASAEPIKGLSLRAAYKRGETGSKVERLPNFYASKRSDNATVLSVRYQPIRFASFFGEYAHYVWGPFPSSAAMLGMDAERVAKPGYYIGSEVSYPLTPKLKIGTVVTHEELSRDDSLVKYLAWQRLYNVTMGEKERSTVLRFYLDFSNIVRVGAYYSQLRNPFPWISGIAPVSGFWAYQSRGNDKLGAVFTLRLQ